MPESCDAAGGIVLILILRSAGLRKGRADERERNERTEYFGELLTMGESFCEGFVHGYGNPFLDVMLRAPQRSTWIRNL